jgi:hypothetical protein
MGSAHLLFLLIQITGIAMSNHEEAGPFGLTGDQYWQQPLWQKPAQAFGDHLLLAKTDGIYIDAPSRIFLDKYKTIPVVAFHSGPSEILGHFSFNNSIQMIVSHLETGRIQMAKPGKTPPNAEPDAAPGRSVRELEVDAASLFDLGPKLGRYSTWMLNGPEASNQRELRIYPSPAAEASQETQSRIDHLRKEGGSPYPLWAGPKMSLVQEKLESTGKGQIWRLGNRVDPNGHPRLVLDYRIEGLPRFILPKEKPILDEQRNVIHGNLPVMFIVFDSNRALTLTKQFGIPVVSQPAGTPDKPVLSGNVSLDLSSLIDMSKAPQSRTIWAVSMNHSAMVDLKTMASANQK